MAIGCNNVRGFQRALMAMAALGFAWALPSVAQYPGQLAKPASETPTLRAISVLEWTGDEGHPKASRMLPVAIFDGEALQDGSVYLARPNPLSLASEVEYELQRNGKPIGLYDIAHAGQEQGSWVGFGVWKGLPKPQPKATLKPLPLNPSWSDEDDRPVLHRKHHADEDAPAKSGAGSAKAGAPATDPDRPTLHKKTDESGGDDADRPTLHKKTEDTEASASAPAEEPDPDRPTLRKKRASSEDGKKKKKKDDVGYVESVQNATDPDRPRLKRGKPTDAGPAVLPSLLGMPPDLRQVVAVSDARSISEHLWSFSWADPADEGKMKAELEQVARDALGLTPPPAPAPKHVPGSKRAKSKKLVEPPPPPEPAPLVGEDFRVFELAYGSGATLVLSAHSGGEGTEDKYVTLIAQPDLYGNLLVLHKSTTDAAHLDARPRMRLVDAVDAEADNRGELLFELRGRTQRQFALYRVLRGQAVRVFATAPADLFAGRTEAK